MGRASQFRRASHFTFFFKVTASLELSIRNGPTYNSTLRRWFDDFCRAVLKFCVCLVGSLKDVQLAK